MKTISKLTVFFALALPAAVSGQISITSATFPFVDRVIYQSADSSTIPFISTIPGSFWDFSNAQKFGGKRGILYQQESNHPVFTTATESSEEWVLFGPLPFRQKKYYRKDASGYKALGFSYERQASGLGFITGMDDDSVTFISQNYVFSQPYTEVMFPLTHNTQWTSIAKGRTDFTLDITFLGFNNTPCNLVNYFISSHEAIGYGTSRVPAKGQPGKVFDAVLVKSEVIRIDSFYIDGSPANPFLLAGLNVNQGDTLRTYQYRVFRDSAGMQLLAVIDFEDANYTTVRSAEYSAEFDVLSVLDIAVKEGVLVYPNPVVDNVFTVKVEENAVLLVTDAMGRKADCLVNEHNGLYTVSMQGDVASGIYYLQVHTDTKTVAIKLLVK